MFETYCELFPWDALSRNAVGFDLGCGSGRWAKFVAPRVGKLLCIDASKEAVKVARRLLQGFPHCEFHVASVDAIPIPDGTMDFGYSRGVFHALPDPPSGIKACVAKLKPNAPFLLYTYYALENRSAWYRGIWTASDLIRRDVSRLPYRARLAAASALAVGVYPLSVYRGRRFYTMRNDALDRFGTRVEHRFRADQIHRMMSDAGLDRIVFS